MKNKNFPLLFLMIATLCAFGVPSFLGQVPIDPGTTSANRSSTPEAIGCNDGWDTTFTTNGVNGMVEAVVADGAGNVYIGGNFTVVNGVPASGVAKWNGTSWSALGTGVGTFGTVKAIAVSGSDVYIGGSFGSAGGVAAKNVAKWNGASWSNLGAGLGGGTHVVEAIAIIGSDVYIGGNFNIPDGSPAEGIVRWNGTAYSTVGPGILGQVNTLSANGGSLYAGGNITLAGGNSIGILKWDGTAWSTLGTSANSNISAIAFSGTDIYAVGTIRVGTQSSSVARYNGTTWTGMQTFSSAFVSSAVVFGGDLYVGGEIPGSTFNNIARWTGTAWVGVSGGLTGDSGSSPRVNGMTVVGSTLVVGGSFTKAGTTGARNIATITSGTWSGFQGTGLDAPAAAIAVSGSDVYVGGSFVSAGSVTANKIAKWNSVTNTWSTLGAGVSGEFNYIRAIAVAGGKVYAGGNFSTIGGVSASNIAVWNGTSWSALGTGVNANVTVIKVVGEDVFVGGSFATAGGVPANRIAKWNGTTWSGLNSAAVPNTVTGIEFIGNDMYVSSDSTTLDNPNYLVKYDGTNWTGLAPGMGGHGVRSMAVSGTDIYISGAFSAVGGVPATRVAKWNGSTWSALGAGLPPGLPGNNNNVTLAMAGAELFAIGDFKVSAGGPGNHIAKWNGTAWSPVGLGIASLDFSTGTIASGGGDVFIGGPFTTAGCNTSPYFARWRQTVWTGSSSSDWHAAANWGGGSVPPSNSSASIISNNAAIMSADVTVRSLIIAGGRTLTIGPGRTLTVNGSLDLSGGIVAGAGTLVVNGDLNLNSGDITSLGAITINGSINFNGAKISGTSPVTVTACRAGAVSGGSSASFVASPLVRCVNSSGTFRFPVGTGSTYAPVALANVLGSGNFTVEPKPGAYSAVAAGLSANRLQRWWDLTNGGITQADLSFNYSDADVVTFENRYRAFRINGSVATQMPTVLDTAANRATVAGVTAFSPWTLAEGQPAPRTLTGRVTNPNGRGAAGIRVTLTDEQGNTRYAVTNPFGYYRFVEVLTFKFYTVRVSSKKYSFTLFERLVDLDENTPAIDFVSTDN